MTRLYLLRSLEQQGIDGRRQGICCCSCITCWAWLACYLNGAWRVPSARYMHHWLAY